MFSADSKSSKIHIDTPIRYLKGVGPNLAKVFAKIGINTILDLLYFFPRDYQDRSQIKRIKDLVSGQQALVLGEIKNIELDVKRRGFALVRAAISDASGIAEAIWFNQPYLLSFLKRGTKVLISGKVNTNLYRGVLEIAVKDYEKIEGEKDWDKIVPVYPLTEGLYQKNLRKLIKEALSLCLIQIVDFIPSGILKEEGFPPLAKAISNLHLPVDLRLTSPSRSRLAFEEFFLFQLGLLLMRKAREASLQGIPFDPKVELISQFEKSLPFALTNSQKQVIEELKADMAMAKPMSRLVQGDVGSGKTVVALFSALVAVAGGYQVAIMAPTEILAEQHYLKISSYLKDFSIKVQLLTGSIKAKQKKEILLALAHGEIKMLIGTHALIEEGVNFKNLGLVVIDEQHRFGVRQRAVLRKKGKMPDLLVMTATPIPRTLALTLYGDLDRSIISELPPGRLPVKTYFVPKNKRRDSYEFIRKEIKNGRQVFVVCPLIEESETLTIKAAQVEGELLQAKIFPEFKVAVMHGRLKGEEKQAIMNSFQKGETHVLVSTSVIEVGIDIPNATIMIIEQVERFGLSQLHQLRGRIGRGCEQSYCFLFGAPLTEEAKQRVKALIDSNDGFKIAESDLQIRGPGDFFGEKQSGLPTFKVADIILDEHLLRLAREKALQILAKDPKLENSVYGPLKQQIFKRYGGFLGLESLEMLS
ncbi:MAG: ATP-dependent DNA helicase RecG [Candidatus Saganbacteria bacterium]|nr:ATP-dependent DNA helicase RecG [Candidatus Saganbacteria bacterium]